MKEWVKKHTRHNTSTKVLFPQPEQPQRNNILTRESNKINY